MRTVTWLVLGAFRLTESTCEGEFDTYDRLDAEFFCCLRKFHDPAYVVVIGNSEGV